MAGKEALPSEARPHEVTIKLHPQTKLNLDLIEKKYGFTINDVINVAPLFFLKAAQEALARQSLKLQADREEFLKYFHAHGTWHKGLIELFGVIDTADIEPDEYFGRRETCVENYDLFESGADWFYEEDMGHINPFAKFMADECLSHRLGTIYGDPFTEYLYFSDLRIPKYSICQDDLEKITCGSSEATLALMQGIVTLPEIPTDLWEPRNAGKRVEWLEEKYRHSQEEDKATEEE